MIHICYHSIFLKSMCTWCWNRTCCLGAPQLPWIGKGSGLQMVLQVTFGFHRARTIPLAPKRHTFFIFDLSFLSFYQHSLLSQKCSRRARWALELEAQQSLQQGKEPSISARAGTKSGLGSASAGNPASGGRQAATRSLVGSHSGGSDGARGRVHAPPVPSGGRGAAFGTGKSSTLEESSIILGLPDALPATCDSRFRLLVSSFTSFPFTSFSSSFSGTVFG